MPKLKATDTLEAATTGEALEVEATEVLEVEAATTGEALEVEATDTGEKVDQGEALALTYFAKCDAAIVGAIEADTGDDIDTGEVVAALVAVPKRDRVALVAAMRAAWTSTAKTAKATDRDAYDIARDAIDAIGEACDAALASPRVTSAPVDIVGDRLRALVALDRAHDSARRAMLATVEVCASPFAPLTEAQKASIVATLAGIEAGTAGDIDTGDAVRYLVDAIHASVSGRKRSKSGAPRATTGDATALPTSAASIASVVTGALTHGGIATMAQCKGDAKTDGAVRRDVLARVQAREAAGMSTVVDHDAKRYSLHTGDVAGRVALRVELIDIAG